MKSYFFEKNVQGFVSLYAVKYTCSRSVSLTTACSLSDCALCPQTLCKIILHVSECLSSFLLWFSVFSLKFAKAENVNIYSHICIPKQYIMPYKFLVGLTHALTLLHVTEFWCKRLSCFIKEFISLCYFKQKLAHVYSFPWICFSQFIVNNMGLKM